MTHLGAIARRGIAAMLAALAMLAIPLAAQTVAAPQASASAPAKLPLRQGGDDAGPFTAMGPLLAVMGVAAIGLWFWLNLRGRGMAGVPAMGRWGGMVRGQGRVQVVERTALSPTSAIVLVRWDDSELLIATTAQGVTVLSERKLEPAKKAEEPPCA
jgi:hypothetical protein